MANNENYPVNVEEHEKTFAGFVRFVAWAMVLIVVFLVFLAIVNG